MKRVTKFLSLAIAMLLAVSFFSIDSYAMSSVAQQHVRELSVEEQQLISTMFNAEQYAKMYPDVVEVLGTDEAVLFNHFITYGIWEQRQPSVAFNVDVYATRNIDLQQEYGDDIIAYYIYFAGNPGQQAYRPSPVPSDALWNDCVIYSVYDFVKGQIGPKAGAVPVLTSNWYPGYSMNRN
ncbi:MAG: hypothetical protein E7273_00050 [Pseudobutyrivibrio ruminis]|jgi:hypothetical protein|nr:hypothetical protein [Pseudobutyrivibrio ruminis]